MNKRKKLANGLERCARLVGKGWCTGPCAEDANGFAVGCVDKKAVRWCCYGAVLRTAKSNFLFENELCDAFTEALPDRFKKRGIVHWNEVVCRSSRQAASMFRRAARLALKTVKKETSKCSS